MSEKEFLDLAESTLNTIEAAMDRLNDEDVDRRGMQAQRQRARDRVHRQWSARSSSTARRRCRNCGWRRESGGFHYKRVGDEWRNTRDDSANSSRRCRKMASEQGGKAVTIS